MESYFKPRLGRKSVLIFENNGSRCMAKALVGQNIQEFTGFENRTTVISSDNDETRSDESKDLYESLDNIGPKACSSCEKGWKPPPVTFTARDHWQTNLLTPTQRLTELYNLGHLSDLTITFSDSDEVIKAHKLMLASASFVFERMLYTDTKEARTGQVKLHCSVEGMKWVLNSLYRGGSELQDVVTALRVYGVAQEYQMNAISDMCKDYLRYQVSLDNVSEVFSAAKLFSEDSLMNACLSKLNASWSSVVEEHISEITEELWMYLLQRPVLPTPELMLFKGLVSWAKYHLELDEEPTSPANIRQKIEKFLPHVRLLCIPLDSFIDNVVPTQVFSPEECTNILMTLRGISSPVPSSLPCSPILHDRIDFALADLKHIVLTRMSNDRRKANLATVSDMVLVKDLTVSRPILVQQIQTQDNSTLKLAQMIVSDSNGKQVGIAKPLGPTWRFVQPVFMHANRPYQITIDKVLVSKAFYKKDFCSLSGDIKFRGCTGDNYIRLGFWPAQKKA